MQIYSQLQQRNTFALKVFLLRGELVMPLS
jgi:hypothetical protein